MSQECVTPEAPIRNNLAAYRGDRSLREVAAKVGLTAGGLLQLEAGTIFPKRATLERLCSYYGCDVGDLYSIRDFPPN